MTDSEVCDMLYQQNRDQLFKQISELSNNGMKFSRNNFWKLKNKICHKIQKSGPVAKIDENGQLLSNVDELKKLEVRFYKKKIKKSEN